MLCRAFSVDGPRSHRDVWSRDAVALSADQQMLVLVPRPISHADVDLVPDQVRPILEAPVPDEVHALDQLGSCRPQKHDRVVQGAAPDILGHKLIDAHGRVLIFNRAIAPSHWRVLIPPWW